MGASETTIGLDKKLLIADAMVRGIEVEFIFGGLLKLVGFVNLNAVPRFVVADNFKEGNVVGGREIAWVGPNFKKHYYNGADEENVSERTIPIWEFVKHSFDAPIVHILGGVDKPKAQTHLAHTFQLMELGAEGFGRLDGYANLSYKMAKDGKLWVPGWGVFGGELRVEAGSSSGPSEWDVSDRVSGG